MSGDPRFGSHGAPTGAGGQRVPPLHQPNPAHLRPSSSPPPLQRPPAQQPPPPRPADEDEAIELIEDEPFDVPDEPTSPAPGGQPMNLPHPAQPAPKKITFGPEIQHRVENWTRQPHANGQGSVRVRSFHGKLSEQGLEYMDHHINEWLDRHPEIEVKFVTSSIGVFDGKIKEPAVILQVWY